MTKQLPADTLIMSHNKLPSLAMRDPERKSIIKEASGFYEISISNSTLTPITSVLYAKNVYKPSLSSTSTNLSNSVIVLLRS